MVRWYRSIQVKLPQLNLLALRHQNPSNSRLGVCRVSVVPHIKMCGPAYVLSSAAARFLHGLS
ncbi:MAG: hypothetical protein ACHP7P_16090, partial [Terriglobales bacterium]